MLGLILTFLQDRPLILTCLQDRPLLPIQGQDCTSKTPTMHVHEHIMTTLANQQLVVKHSPAWLSEVGVQQFSPALLADQRLWKPDPTCMHSCGEAA